MVIIGILAFRGSSLDGLLAHMRRAIQNGATKRELLEAIQSAAVPGGGPTFAAGCRPLMQLDSTNLQQIGCAIISRPNSRPPARP
jgi:alkylhydroperoxidase/carboxymuconolactone decarboxylase family protein YurZ